MKELVINNAGSVLAKIAEKIPQSEALRGLKIGGIVAVAALATWGILKL